MTRAIRITPITEETFPAWRELRLRALHDHPDAFGQPHADYKAIPLAASLAQFRERQATGLSFVLGAFSDDDLIGTVGIVREQRLKESHRMMIWGMYVAPEARGTGTADALVKAAIAQARATDGVLQIHLAVTAHNIAARKLYERHSFVRYGTDPRALRVNGQPYDEDLMVLIFDNYPIPHRL